MEALYLAGGLSNALPVAAGIVGRRRLTAARWWVLAWGVESSLATALQFVVSRHGPNLWLSYFTAPVEGSLVLFALSCWQERTLYRLTLRWVIAVALALHLASLFYLEDTHGFSIASVPTYSIVCLAAALFTLASRSLGTAEPLLRQDWFWASAGFAFYCGALGVITPLSSSLRGDISALLLVYRGFNSVEIIAYGLVAVGLLCPPGGPRTVAPA